MPTTEATPRPTIVDPPWLAAYRDTAHAQTDADKRYSALLSRADGILGADGSEVLSELDSIVGERLSEAELAAGDFALSHGRIESDRAAQLQREVDRLTLYLESIGAIVALASQPSCGEESSPSHP